MTKQELEKLFEKSYYHHLETGNTDGGCGWCGRGVNEELVYKAGILKGLELAKNNCTQNDGPVQYTNCCSIYDYQIDNLIEEIQKV